MNGTFFPDQEGQGRKDILTSVMVYDTATDKWSTAPDMLVGGRVGQRAASVDGKIYVIGGNRHGAACNKTQIFDPATNQWTMGPDMIKIRGNDFGVAVLDGNIYAVGGQGSGAGALADMEFLDTRPATTLQAATQATFSCHTSRFPGLFCAASETQSDCLTQVDNDCHWLSGPPGIDHGERCRCGGEKNLSQAAGVDTCIPRDKPCQDSTPNQCCPGPEGLECKQVHRLGQICAPTQGPEALLEVAAGAIFV